MSQPQDPRERLRKGDEELFVNPWANHSITSNEIHAALMGLVGLVLGLAYVEGFAGLAVSLLVFLTGYAIIGSPAFMALPHDHEDYEKTIGLKTIRHEPWWFIPVLLATFSIIVVIL